MAQLDEPPSKIRLIFLISKRKNLRISFYRKKLFSAHRSLVTGDTFDVTVKERDCDLLLVGGDFLGRTVWEQNDSCAIGKHFFDLKREKLQSYKTSTHRYSGMHLARKRLSVSEKSERHLSRFHIIFSVYIHVFINQASARIHDEYMYQRTDIK